MQTLEERVDRLERSCRRWRMGFCAMAVGAVALGAAGHPADAEFGHLTVQSLVVRSEPGGAMVMASGDKDGASITVAGAGSSSMILLSAQKDAASASVSRNTAKGMTVATLRADEQSGTVDVRNVDGKNKAIEPE